MKKTLIASLIAAGLASAFGAQAADENVSPWLIRLRAINIDPDSSSSAGGAARFPENAISVRTAGRRKSTSATSSPRTSRSN